MAVITSPFSGMTIDAANVKSVMGLIYADLNSFADSITGADISFRYPEMERSYGEWGAILREGRIPYASGQSVNKNATAMCPTAYFNANSRIYDAWTEKVYRSEIRRVDITKVLRGEMEYAELLRRIIQRNVEGFRAETNTGIEKAMFSQSPAPEDAGSGEVGAYKTLIYIDPPSVSVEAGGGWLQSDGTSNPKVRLEMMSASTSYADIWAQVLFRVMDMELENDTYTIGNERYGGDMRDFTIYVPAKFAAFSDVKYLQTLQNFRGMDRLPRVRVHGAQTIEDADHKNAYDAIFILDNRVLNHVTRYMSYDEDTNNCRKSQIYDLHVEDMIKYVPFYKAWGIVLQKTLS